MSNKVLIYCAFFFGFASISSHQLIDDYWPLFCGFYLQKYLSDRLLLDDIFEKVHEKKINDENKTEESKYLKSLLKRKIELGYDCAIAVTVWASLLAFIEIEYDGNLRNGHFRLENSLVCFYKMMVKLSYFLHIIKMGHLFYFELNLETKREDQTYKQVFTDE